MIFFLLFLKDNFARVHVFGPPGACLQLRGAEVPRILLQVEASVVLLWKCFCLPSSHKFSTLDLFPFGLNADDRLVLCMWRERHKGLIHPGSVLGSFFCAIKPSLQK